MFLRELFEAPTKTAAFALGRLNPATTGHELLVNAIKQAPGDSFLFLTDRAPKLPTDPLSAEEKLDWARKSFDGISVGTAKTVLTAADRLYKMGYRQVTFLEGEPKLFKLLQQYNGVEKEQHNFTFDKIDYVQLQRDPDAEDATGMSASKLRQTVVDNDFESFKKGVTQSAQPYAEEMFKKLQGLLGVDAVGESVEIPVVNYDRDYGGDINKVLAVKPNARADAEKIYKQLGGISNDNYKKMQELVQAKIQELRKQYQAKAAKDGLKGKDALHSDHYKLFRKQSNDLKIMMATAMDMMVKASGAKPGKIIGKQMDLDTLKRLAGVNEYKGYTEYKLEENPSITADKLKKKEKKMGLKPGDPEWFKLWFSLPYMTGNMPAGFRGRKK